jgi:hypothetical protein
MLLSSILILGGFCIGILSGGSRVPEARLLPTLSSFVGTAALAAALFVVQPGNLGAAILLIVATVGASVFYSAWLWKGRLTDTSVGYGWIVLQQFLRPRVLPNWYREQSVPASEPVVGPTS